MDITELKKSLELLQIGKSRIEKKIKEYEDIYFAMRREKINQEVDRIRDVLKKYLRNKKMNTKILLTDFINYYQSNYFFYNGQIKKEPKSTIINKLSSCNYYYYTEKKRIGVKDVEAYRNYKIIGRFLDYYRSL
jgi:hypothetical protein